MLTPAKIKEAMEEIAQKTYVQIQTETAWKWAARAAAAYEMLMLPETEKDKVDWWMEAEEYRHESLEHAALIEDNGNLVQQVQKSLDKYRN